MPHGDLKPNLAIGPLKFPVVGEVKSTVWKVEVLAASRVISNTAN